MHATVEGSGRTWQRTTPLRLTIRRAAAETRGHHALEASAAPPGVAVLIVLVPIDAAGRIVSPPAVRPVAALRAVAATVLPTRARGALPVLTTVADNAPRIVTVRASVLPAIAVRLSAGVPIVVGVRIVRPVSKMIGSAHPRSPRRSRREILRRPPVTSSRPSAKRTRMPLLVTLPWRRG